MDRTKRTGFKVSLTLHGLALALALAIPWACTMHEKSRPVEPMPVVQIPITVRNSAAPDIPAPKPSATEPQQPEPIPEPAKEVLPEQKEKESEPPKKPKTVEKQTNRVVRTPPGESPPEPPAHPTEENIKEILTANIPAGDSVVLEPGPNHPVLDAYYRQVYSRMYAAWVQPAQLKTLPGLSTDVRMVVAPSGKITRWEKVRSSGNDLMDDSVVKAMRSVKELPPLPREYQTPREIVVTFEIGN